MQTDPTTLPDDIASLKAMIIARDSALRDHAIEIDHLKLLIAKLKRQQFGHRSEKLDRQIEQIELKLEELQTDEGVAATSAPRARTAHGNGGRNPLPAHLEREDLIHTPAETTCCACGGAFEILGEGISEQLELVPARLRVIRHRRVKLAGTGCDRIVQAPGPSRPIDGGIPGPDLLANVLVSKFCDHQPLYRQRVRWEREGIDLPESTLG